MAYRYRDDVHHAGMALGGWLAGELYDRTQSYFAAFIMALGFNALNAGIAITLLRRQRA